jgi:hypothetical protein
MARFGEGTGAYSDGLRAISLGHLNFDSVNLVLGDMKKLTTGTIEITGLRNGSLVLDRRVPKSLDATIISAVARNVTWGTWTP